MSRETDNELVSRCLEGDQRAYGELIDRYQKPVFNHALRTLGDERDAEDVTQNVFMKAYQHLANFNPDYKFFSWVYRIAINETINAAKRKRRHDALDDADAPTFFVDRDSEQEVLEGLWQLGAEDRALVLLKHFEGFSYAEIEYIMDVPLKTVKSRLYTARQRLKDILTRERRIQND
ncbi:MAG: sigma-70 family RNA polymerase sigma factor [Rhodothermales bacterium]|nr:sigma-70 family RNA polymerase sigma factor [Rhodothermales bacterium]